MKETTKTAPPARDALIDFIKNLTPEQADKLVKRMPLLELLPTLTPNELIYTEEFSLRVFGGQKSA